jgi:hypothetical protein
MKILNKVLLAVISLTTFSFAQADITIPSTPSTTCVSQSEIKEIASHFSQFSKYANAEYCLDGSTTANLISSLMFMRHTAFDAAMNPSKDELFSGKFAKSWYDYFIGRIDELEVVANCPKGVVAYVYAFGGKTMYACPLALTDTFSSLDRASVFMHEARHIDGYPHVTCSKGPRQGISGACDKKISDGGSYAVTVETYAQIAKFATDLHPALKAYARSSAVVYADEAFENAVRINRSENLLLVTADLDIQAMNVKTGAITALGKAPAAGHIVHRGQHLVLFPDDKNLKAEYMFARNEGVIDQSPGEIFVDYNNQTPAEKANLVDLHVGAQWTARVYKNSIKFACDPTSAATTDIQIPAGQVAANLIYVNGYDRGVYSTNLVMQSGDIYELGCASRKAYLKASPAVKLDQKYKRLYKTDGRMMALSAEGRLYSVEDGKSVPVAHSTQYIEIIPQQSFEFFETN